MPTYRTDAQGAAICPHRDLSVCPDCATDPHLVAVAGVHYHLPLEVDRIALRRELARVTN